jgi:hypothetical protein
VPLRTGEEPPAGPIESRAVPGRRKDVVKLAIGRGGEADAVRRDEREPLRATELDQSVVPELLTPEAVPLELHRDPARKRRRKPIEKPPGCRRPPLGKSPRQRPLVPSGQAEETPTQLLDISPPGPSFPLRMPSGGDREEPAEVPVASPIDDQKGQTGKLGKPETRFRRLRNDSEGPGQRGRAAGSDKAHCFRPGRSSPASCRERRRELEGDLGSDDRPDSRPLRRLVKPGNAIEPVPVGEGHGGKTDMGRPEGEILREGGAVEKGEGRGRVELDPARSERTIRPDPELPSPQLFLSRAGGESAE